MRLGQFVSRGNNRVDVKRLDDRPDCRSAGIDHRRSGVGDVVEIAVLVDEHVFAANLVAFGKRPVDGAFFDREGRPVGVLVMDQAVEAPSDRLFETVTGQFFGSAIHERTVLLLIHHEDGHPGVVQDGIQPGAGPFEAVPDRVEFGNVPDRCEENELALGLDQLQRDRDFVSASVFSAMHRLERKPGNFCG